MKTVSAVEFVILFHLFFCNDLLTCDTLANVAGNSIFQDVTIRDDEVIFCNMIISIKYTINKRSRIIVFIV